jgi:hypothetical protein
MTPSKICECSIRAPVSDVPVQGSVQAQAATCKRRLLPALVPSHVGIREGGHVGNEGFLVGFFSVKSRQSACIFETARPTLYHLQSFVSSQDCALLILSSVTHGIVNQASKLAITSAVNSRLVNLHRSKV